jgi:CheY-like chemotaxis protein
MTDQIDILLVEDDPGDVRLAMAVLRAIGMASRTVVANDGQEALDFLQSQGRYAGRAPGHPALILLDLKMPRVDGFDLLREIKSEAELQLVPVVALTSSGEARDIERAYALGVNGYVVKGISFADFASMLRSLADYWVKVNERPAAAAKRRSLPGTTARARFGDQVAAVLSVAAPGVAFN